MTRFAMTIAAIILCVPAVEAADATLPEGSWRLTQHYGAVNEYRICLFKVERKDGGTGGSLIDTAEIPPRKKGDDPKKLEVKLLSFKADAGRVEIVVEFNDIKQTFRGPVDPKDPKLVFGTLDDDRRVTRATLTRQDGDQLKAIADVEKPKVPEPQAKLQKLAEAVAEPRRKAYKSEDVDEKADLLEQAKAAQKEYDAQAPGLHRDTFNNYADSPYSVDSAMQLVRGAAKNSATTEEVRKWVAKVEIDAARYGHRFSVETNALLAEILRGQKGFAADGLVPSRKAAEGIDDTIPLHVQERILRVLKSLQVTTGKADDGTDARLAQVSATLEKQYEATVPPFKPTAFEGRKDRSANRAVVMELFTGAQCPPCVAADVAFDALEKAHKPTNLILIQYHLHIPGPDPMTNPDSVARWEYYQKLFEKEVQGTPTPLFNGKPYEHFDSEPKHGGGGPMSWSEDKFKQYRAVIDPLLDQKTDVKLSGTARRSGDKVAIETRVDGVKDAGDDIRLRLVLVEEAVRYVGGNGLRVHHQVVRAIPDVKTGTTVKEPSLKKATEFDLGGLRSSLNGYLDEYAVEHPFPYDERPLALGYLKVIALVQNDRTGEILNATQFDVEGK